MKFMLAGFFFTILLTSPVLAHHSGVAFNHSEIITLNGVIKKYHFSQPHVWIVILTSPENGSIEQWNIEGESPAIMARIGLNRKALKSGENVQISFHPLKDGHNGGSFIDITLADGTYIESAFE